MSVVWEYGKMEVEIPIEEYEDVFLEWLNKLGRDGWELVFHETREKTLHPIGCGRSQTMIVFSGLFKRMKDGGL